MSVVEVLDFRRRAIRTLPRGVKAVAIAVRLVMPRPRTCGITSHHMLDRDKVTYRVVFVRLLKDAKCLVSDGKAVGVKRINSVLRRITTLRSFSTSSGGEAIESVVLKQTLRLDNAIREEHWLVSLVFDLGDVARSVIGVKQLLHNCRIIQVRTPLWETCVVSRTRGADLP